MVYASVSLKFLIRRSSGFHSILAEIYSKIKPRLSTLLTNWLHLFKLLLLLPNSTKTHAVFSNVAQIFNCSRVKCKQIPFWRRKKKSGPLFVCVIVRIATRVKISESIRVVITMGIFRGRMLTTLWFEKSQAFWSVNNSAKCFWGTARTQSVSCRSSGSLTFIKSPYGVEDLNDC